MRRGAVALAVVSAAFPLAAGAEDPIAVSFTVAVATAEVPAVRMERPEQPFELIMVGDSITVGARAQLAEAYADAGWTASIDARSGRSISFPPDPRLSGVDVVRGIKADGTDAPVWVVALGTNDLYFASACRCDQLAFSTARIRSLLAEIGPARTVVWVNPQNFDYTNLARLFDDALAGLVATGEIQAVVPWRTHSAAHEADWFVDHVHLNAAGNREWISLILDAVGTG